MTVRQAYTFSGVPKITVEQGKTTNFYNYSKIVIDNFTCKPHTGANGDVDYYGVTMTVYNALNLYGVVTSYNANGKIYEVQVIDKKETYQASLVSNLKELEYQVGDIFFQLDDEKYYSGKSISKETPISLRVPAGGHLQILNSIDSSMVVLTNVICLMVEGTASVIKLSNNADNLSKNRLQRTEEIINDTLELLNEISPIFRSGRSLHIADSLKICIFYVSSLISRFSRSRIFFRSQTRPS